jgi:DNA-binding LacI/PurR family transcriptional regulator
MRKSYEVGVNIPRDLSVVGFDDIRFAQYILPPLTTVQMSQSELARLAFEALRAEVAREKPLPQGSQFELETSLVVRESTAAAS